MADLTDYTGLITSEHNQRLKFMAVVEALAQPMVALQNLLGSMPDKFDLDQAVGVQLDAVGLWVGISRRVATPLTGVYFSFDTAGVGFDQGNWKGPFDPDTGLTQLDDDTYRLVLRAKIGANHWDGTLESSAAILNSIFSPGDGPVAIHADDEPFGTGNGATSQFQLLYQGQPVYQVDSATLYRNDWQGNQQQYPTARTNLITRSQELDNIGAWPQALATVASNATTAPDGTLTADKLIANTTNGNHYISQPRIGSNETVTISAFCKAAEYSTVELRLSNFATASIGCCFNLGNGTVLSMDGANSDYSAPQSSIYPVGSGWYRCVFTVTKGNANTQNRGQVTVTNNSGATIFAGDGTSGVYAWGVQLEAGSVATSYIPTTTVPVTRTDYTLGPTGIVLLAVPPVSGAALTWTGDGKIYPSGTYVFIQDNQDMSMTIGVAGKVPSAVFLALLEGGYIPLKPEGVRINYVIVTSVDGVPLFGFDVENQFVAGFDVGAWGTPL